MKRKNGITLIALVITIIVLLFLAGVSISMISGDDGIVLRASDAAEKTKQSTADEGAKLEESEEYIENMIAPGFTVVFLLVAGGAVYATKQGLTKVEFPENPTKSGHDFTGWYYDEACTNKANEGDEITANSTLYAGWQQSIANCITSKNYSTAILGGGGSSIANYVTSKNITSYELELLEDVYNQLETSDFRADISGKNLSIYLQNESISTGENIAKLKLKVVYEDGSCDYDEFNFSAQKICLAEGTKIKLADGTSKNIEDITYDDELLVWDFDNGNLASSKPLWIKREEITNEYNLLKFENGSILKTISQHRIFNKELGKFTYPMTDETPVGTTTVISTGEETKLISKEVVKEEVKYYNVITNYHMNLFAEDILTSCRLSNLYEIKDMKYVKDNRILATKEEYPDIPEEFFNGLRIAEQPKEVNRGCDDKHDKDLNGYVQRLINIKK